jgi:hypothetical protein
MLCRFLSPELAASARRTRALPFILAGAALLAALPLGLAGCGDNPVHGGDDDHCDHVDADGVVLEEDGSLVTYQWQDELSGSLDLVLGADARVLAITYLDADSARVAIDEDCDDFALGWTFADTTIAAASRVDGERWLLAVHGRQQGETTLRVRLMDGDHADFTSLPLAVDVAPPPARPR